MNLKLYNKNPWGLLHDMDRDFENFWDFPVGRKKQAFPACDFYEDKEHYFISLDLPGMKKENIKINYENKTLTVSGTRKEEYKEEDRENHSRFMEKFYGSFNRSFTLPSSIDEEKTSAHFADGVLELFLPKSTQSKGREISVQEGKRKHKLFSKPKKEAV